MTSEGSLSKRPAGPAAGLADETDWTYRFAARLRITDALVLAYALAGTHIIWFGRHSPLVA